MPNSAVLIVDDEPLIRETVSELLSSAGLSTLAAHGNRSSLPAVFLVGLCGAIPPSETATSD
jgi:CheY-like chemotaxis protein